MNDQNKARRAAVVKAGGVWRKAMRTPHETLVWSVFRNKEKQTRGK